MSLNNKLPINEFFATIQGEATYIGTPSFFLRVQKSPVACGFCDTKYTWDLNPEDETDNIQEIIDKNSLDFSKGEGNSRYVNLSNDQIKQQGGNSSMIHIDWMIGSGEINVDGIKTDGSSVPVFRNGEWAG